jgi:hypothetical protein
LQAAHELSSSVTGTGSKDGSCKLDMSDPSCRLFAAALECEGLSGRTLRKLPFLAHATRVQQRGVSFAKYSEALIQAAISEKRARESGGLEQTA